MKLQDLWFLGLILVFTIPQLTSTCVPSFNSVILTVVEKSVMKIYLMRTDGMPGGRKEERREGRNKWMTEGQGKSSIVPPFCLETHSKEMRRKKNKESVVLLACDTPTWLMSLPNIIKLSQTVCELLPVQDFGFRVDNYITKKVWFVSLARDTPTSPYLLAVVNLDLSFRNWDSKSKRISRNSMICMLTNWLVTLRLTPKTSIGIPTVRGKTLRVSLLSKEEMVMVWLRLKLRRLRSSMVSLLLHSPILRKMRSPYLRSQLRLWATFHASNEGVIKWWKAWLPKRL